MKGRSNSNILERIKKDVQFDTVLVYEEILDFLKELSKRLKQWERSRISELFGNEMLEIRDEWVLREVEEGLRMILVSMRDSILRRYSLDIREERVTSLVIFRTVRICFEDTDKKNWLDLDTLLSMVMDREFLKDWRGVIEVFIMINWLVGFLNKLFEKLEADRKAQLKVWEKIQWDLLDDTVKDIVFDSKLSGDIENE